jgi:AAA15 family ATPase/GTPase
MLTHLIVRNFKLFDEVEIELGVVFVGPDNSGKTSALQALALWSVGVRRWVEKRGAGNVPVDHARRAGRAVVEGLVKRMRNSSC